MYQLFQPQFVIQFSRGSSGGQKGEKGQKGEPAPTPSGPLTFEVPSAIKGSQKNYTVKCFVNCFNVGIFLKVESGDADLYGKTESVPEIEESDCDDCSLCRSRSSQLTDQCEISTATSNIFYVAVVAHKDYRNAKITFTGTNLESVDEQ